MLRSITLKTGELLGADRTTIFLLDEDKNELWSIVAKGDTGDTLEIRIPADKGIAGEVATFKKVVNIPFDFFDDPRSAQSKKTYKKTGYRTYTMLCMPLLNEKEDLVAVVQLMNKLKKVHDPEDPLSIASIPKALPMKMKESLKNSRRRYDDSGILSFLPQSLSATTGCCGPNVGNSISFQEQSRPRRDPQTGDGRG